MTTQEFPIQNEYYVINHKVCCKLLCQQTQAQINRDNIRKNIIKWRLGIQSQL